MAYLVEDHGHEPEESIDRGVTAAILAMISVLILLFALAPQAIWGNFGGL
ncbi:MAG TPA: hypothetical protein VFB16_09075 [Bauldia sp.]|nr:hypothetical protein [Bauldia sp.]